MLCFMSTTAMMTKKCKDKRKQTRKELTERQMLGDMKVVTLQEKRKGRMFGGLPLCKM